MTEDLNLWLEFLGMFRQSFGILTLSHFSREASKQNGPQSMFEGCVDLFMLFLGWPWGPHVSCALQRWKAGKHMLLVYTSLEGKKQPEWLH